MLTQSEIDTEFRDEGIDHSYSKEYTGKKVSFDKSSPNVLATDSLLTLRQRVPWLPLVAVNLL